MVKLQYQNLEEDFCPNRPQRKSIAVNVRLRFCFTCKCLTYIIHLSVSIIDARYCSLLNK